VNDDRVSRQVLVDGDEIRVGEATFRFLLDEEEKPKKKEGPARMADVFGAPGSPSAGGAGAADAAVPKIEVKERVLQYSKKAVNESITKLDVSQTAGVQRAVIVLILLALAGAAFYGVMKLVGG
jgi:hypothetical protein